jgi:hypothetical protein
MLEFLVSREQTGHGRATIETLSTQSGLSKQILNIIGFNLMMNLLINGMIVNAELFASYLQEPDSLPAERLLDSTRSFAPDDKLLHHFRNLFMPKYYLRPLRDRLEAVRLGAFNVPSLRRQEYH